MSYRLSVFVGRLLFLLVVGFFISSTSVFGQTGSIGDRVWNDLDGDGIQDAGETGVDGVTVSLYDGTMRWLNYTTTSGGGAYSFTNLDAGDYILKFKNFPAGYSISPQDQGGDDSADSDANTTTGNTATISLSSGEVDNSVDCGLVVNSTTGTIGNIVWNDTDGDGIQDGGESGVDGVTVSLYDGTMRWLNYTTTSGGGAYSFTNLAAGDYILKFKNFPAGYTISPQDQGGDDAVDSDADPTTGNTATISLSSGEVDNSVDCGISTNSSGGSISNFVWIDTDADGIQDGGEAGYNGVTVTLYQSDGTTVISTTTTAGGGLYSFTSLSAGSYVVGFTLPAGYSFSSKDQGSDDAVDSDANTSTGKTATITLSTNENNTSIDCGLIVNSTTGSIGNIVWNDTDADGIQDGGESGVDGVTVSLYDGTMKWLNYTTTSGGGAYSFTNLTAGDYILRFKNFPAGYTISPQDQGGDDSADSDANPTTGNTATINLSSGEIDNSIDCGITTNSPSASISNFVWIDTDADGIQDGVESGHNGVIVTLYQSDGTTVLSTTITAGGGLYSFTSLSAGSYVVGFTLPAGYSFSSKDQGSDDAVDSDANTSTGKTVTITLSTDENNTSIDCGLVVNSTTGTIGNIVWNDTDGDGIQDGGESGVDGVTVSLYDGTMRWLNYTTTSGGGAYSFTNLAAGDYILKFKNFPAGYTISPQDQGGDDSADSDANPTTGNTATISLSAGEVDNSVDCGITTISPSASISNFVWNDTDADGIQDGGESGLNGVSVTLYESDGTTVVISTTTSGGGLYSFTGLLAGDYIVGFTLASGYVFSPLNQGGDDTVDNDVERTSAKTTAITLSSGESDTSVDCGMVYGTSINGWVWNDTDQDGIQDAGETTGIAGVTVNFYQHDGVTVDATTTTLSDGSYNLTTTNNAGNHRMGFVLPSGYSYSPHNVGSNDLIDSDPDPSTGYGYSFDYADGMTIYYKDAGLYSSPNTIGNFVWIDTNSDGIQDAGEIGLNDVTVTLYWSDGTTVVSSTTTAGGGIYSFSGLTDGSYIIAYTPPTDYSISLQNQGGDDTKDSDANTGTGKTSIISLSGGETDNTNDCGFINSGTASISNFIWDDADYDGIQDGGETGINGVPVTLYQSDGTSIITTTSTAGGGSYSFLNLAAGNYIIGVTKPAGKEFSPQDQGGDDDLDSDLNQSTGKTSAIILSSGETNTSIDCGLLTAISISGTAWLDANENGINDGGEIPLNGSITVKLYESDGTTLLQTTSTSLGAYSFSVPPGSYIVEFSERLGYSFSPMDTGSDDSKDSDVNTSTGKTAVITVSVGSSNTTTDCGIYESGYSFTNCLVWDDLNMDGIQDAGEPGIDGVEVTLYLWYHGAGYQSIRTTTTSGGGLYSFTGLNSPADDMWPYGIGFTLPNEYDTFSPKDQGSDDTKDSDVSTTGFKGDLWFTTTTISNIDCGMYNSVTAPSISNFVWNDSNANGIQDPVESGINGITVSLYSGTDTWIDYTTTSGGGSYGFSSLAPGDYKVRFLLPSGYVFSPKNQGSDDTKDSDVNSATMKTDVFTLSAGENNRTIDCGLIVNSSISIGNKVWLDTDQDGKQEYGEEAGLDGVTVSLYSGTDRWLNYTTTSGGGLYSFTGLEPGSYKVRFLLPSGYVYSPINQGGDDTKDSDVNYSTMKTDVFTLTAGANTTVDCGLVQGIAFNGKVWKDTDYDGIQDADETGLYGVTVKLYQSDGTTLVATTTTANYDPQLRGGNYNFTLGSSGTYIVKFILPTDYSFSPQNVGGDDTKDSDANTSTGETAAITLSVGGMSNNLDCGLINNGTASISNFVWEDTDDDGIQDGGETGVNGVTVSLYHGDGTWLNYTTSSGGGLYSFTGLAAGTYKVRFKNFPDNYVVGAINQGSDDTKDSDVNPSTGYTAYFSLGSGVNDTSVDCGLDFDIENGPIIGDIKINTAGPDKLGINTEIGRSVSIYPNPSSLGYFKLLLNEFEGKTNIKIVDIQGRVAKSFDVFDTGEITIGTSDQKEGTYFVIITNNKKAYTKKIIVLD